MPDFMKTYEQELHETPIPPPQLPKRDLTIAWLSFFDDSSLQYPDSVDRFARGSQRNIHAAFLWTKDHFAELDLGGNFKWFSAANKALGYMTRKKWNNETQARLFLSFLTDTRWYHDGSPP